MSELSNGIERISFVETCAPISMWRHLKAGAYAGGGTATRLCTDSMLEYLAQRGWLRDSSERPANDAPEVQRISVPFSNMDRDGALIVSPIYLKQRGLIELFDRDKQAFRVALETRGLSALIGLAADQLQISRDAFASDFLGWLSVAREPAASTAVGHHSR